MVVKMSTTPRAMYAPQQSRRDNKHSTSAVESKALLNIGGYMWKHDRSAMWILARCRLYSRCINLLFYPLSLYPDSGGIDPMSHEGDISAEMGKVLALPEVLSAFISLKGGCLICLSAGCDGHRLKCTTRCVPWR